MFATSICFFFPEKQEKTLLFKHLPKSKTNPQALNLILVCGLVDFYLFSVGYFLIRLFSYKSDTGKIKS